MCFDHSSGHSKQQPEVLNQNRMNRLLGGKNAGAMRNAIIKQEEGYLWSLPSSDTRTGSNSVTRVHFI
jgi:hypothetical protein